MGGGILPMCFIDNHPHFLFSRESIYQKYDSGLWSDFGGSTEKGESKFETAIREGWEESNGFLGDKDNIRRLLKEELVEHIETKNYDSYLFKMDYDSEIEEIFSKDFKKMVIERNEFVVQYNGFYEKDRVKWMPLRDLNKNMGMFRPWYKHIVRLIIRRFN